VNELLWALKSFGVLREQPRCLIHSCQTDQFAHWHKLWGAGTDRGVRISRTVARAL